MRYSTLLLCAAPGPLFATASSVFDPSNYAESDIIIRDVAIIGGGSAGTYAATELRSLGKSIVIVEKEGELGGHTNTYTDPGTGATVDYGLQAFWNSSITLDYFNHFNITLTNYTGGDFSYRFADFETGISLNITLDEDFTPWAAQLDKYPWLDHSWNVSYPVAEDLLLPFSDFITKYNLSDIAYAIYFSASGLSNPLSQVTVNVMKMVDPVFLDELDGASVAVENHNNGLLYERALSEFGENALLNAVVTAAHRPSTNGTNTNTTISLVVKTPTGNKLIQARQLLIAIPQTPSNMAPFSLSDDECNLFDQWTWMGYHTILFNNTSLPSTYEYVNANSSLSTYNIPALPGPVQITPTNITGLWYAWYRSPNPAITQHQVESDTIATIKRLQEKAGLDDKTPEVVEYRSHTPFKLEVGAEAIKNGFYERLGELQGERGTWWTGAAFVSHDSPVIWEFTKGIVERMVAA